MNLLENFWFYASSFKEDKESEFNSSHSEITPSIDEKFIYNFKKNGGKFLYCENTEELKNNLKTY